MARTLQYAGNNRAAKSDSRIGLVAFLIASFHPILMVIVFSIPSLNELTRRLSPKTELIALLSLPIAALLLGLYAILLSYRRQRSSHRTTLRIARDFILFSQERFGVAASGLAFLIIVSLLWISTLPF